MKLYIGVIGERQCTEEIARIAETVGRLVAEKGAVLVCGGMGGVMEAASRGAMLAKGVVLGILPGLSRREGNPYLTYSIVTDMGEGRNIILVRSCDAIIAIAGSYGTLSEIAFAHKFEIPVIGIQTWSLEIGEKIDEKIIQVSEEKEAVKKALEFAQKSRGI
jgi:uncharacterized protein (TIGR00725 family)